MQNAPRTQSDRNAPPSGFQPANPYQPPATDAAWSPSSFLSGTPKTANKAELAQARRALAEHLATAGNAEADLRRCGGRLRVSTIIGITVLGLVIVGAAALALTIGSTWIFVIGAIFAVLAFTATLAGLINDLKTPARTDATTPEKALEGWMRSAKLGRDGYFLSTLCPSGRETVDAPQLDGYPTNFESYDLQAHKGVKRYLGAWARAGAGFVRQFAFKNFSRVSVDGDVAVVSADVSLTAWPQWANAVAVALFVVIRALGLIAWAVLYYVLRKQAKLTIRKTLLRGDDGLWYVVEPGLQDA